MILPYNKEESKKSEVRAMFDNIALRYDFLNHFLSGGIDIIWRKRVIKKLIKYKPTKVLDMATGTADLAIMAAKSGIPEVVGIDLSPNMIREGQKKLIKKKLENNIELLVGDAESINYNDAAFDAVMIAFGVRNFENLEAGLMEMNRVLKRGKQLFVLEFSKPTVFPIKQLYYFYSFKLLPFIGKLISKDERAYSYLPESINEFPSGKQFAEIIERCNFENCEIHSFSFGISTLYVASKK